MKPIPTNLGLPEIIVAEDQPPYLPLPVAVAPGGVCISRWTFTAEERQAIVNGEDIYLSVLSFGPLHPVKLQVGMKVESTEEGHERAKTTY